MNLKSKCPNCGSAEFVTEPNQYDILIFKKNNFIIQSTEQIDDYRIYCRECGKKVNILKSKSKIVLEE